MKGNYGPMILLVASAATLLAALSTNTKAQTAPGAGGVTGACTGVAGDRDIALRGYFVMATRLTAFGMSGDMREEDAVTRCDTDGEYFLLGLPPGKYGVELLDQQNHLLRASSVIDVVVGTATRVDFKSVDPKERSPLFWDKITSRLLKNPAQGWFWEGHDFSRAIKSFKTERASAPEVRFRLTK